MPARASTSETSSDAVDFTTLDELFIDIRDANRADVGAMANIFIKNFEDDPTAKLLYPHDQIWPVILDMLTRYLADDWTHLRVAWDEYTDTIVGWASISLVDPNQGGDYFSFCDSTTWAGRELLRRETRDRTGPLHFDEVKRAALITQLRRRNQEGQRAHMEGQRLVINTIAIHPDVFVDEIPEIAYKFLDDGRDLAKDERLPLWAQFPRGSPGNLEELFEEIGFIEAGSFELDLFKFASEEHRRRHCWGMQRWTQYLLQPGNWDRGRRY
ncbi:hypothetical protein BDR22DRAFT_822529 [Usnea florida]